jgi:hypothetical protein
MCASLIASKWVFNFAHALVCVGFIECNAIS